VRCRGWAASRPGWVRHAKREGVRRCCCAERARGEAAPQGLGLQGLGLGLGVWGLECSMPGIVGFGLRGAGFRGQHAGSCRGLGCERSRQGTTRGALAGGSD